MCPSVCGVGTKVGTIEMARWLRFAIAEPPNRATTLVYDGSKNSIARLKLATSAVTVSGLQVLSTTSKSTDGTGSHWKCVVDNIIVCRDVYRAQRAVIRLG
jgi:hypothetical protein